MFPPRSVSVTELAERRGCSDRQVRSAVHSLYERGLIVLTKESRPGRQGQALLVGSHDVRGVGEVYQWKPFIGPPWLSPPARTLDALRS